jgi:hypothetical protein
MTCEYCRTEQIRTSVVRSSAANKNRYSEYYTRRETHSIVTATKGTGTSKFITMKEGLMPYCFKQKNNKTT